jgi:hypothetical protein
VARIEKVVLPGMVFVEKFSIRNRKKFDKKTKTNTDFFDDDDEVEMIYSEDECDNQLIIEGADQVEAVRDNQIEQVKLGTEIPVRRGRPPRNKKALVVDDIIPTKIPRKKKVFAAAVCKSDRLMKK